LKSICRSISSDSKEGFNVRVGVTYDLRSHYLAQGYGEEETAEFDRVETIEAIEGALRALGYETERIGNIKDLVARLAAGRSWDLVFNICEGLYGMGREAQVPALLDAYGIPYTFSDPLVLSLTLHKGMTKNVLKACGIRTPDFVVVEDETDIDSIALPFPLFAKPVAEGTGKGISPSSKMTNREDLREVCRDLLHRYRQPVLVETFLPGREFTVGIVGSGKESVALGVVEIVLKEKAESDAYSFVNKENCEELVLYLLAEGEIPDQCKDLSLQAWRLLGCRDAGRIDLRLDGDGAPHILEINSLAGLNPAHSDLPIICSRLNLPYGELIRRIMDSAVKRVRP
jgi:D-alanine-D-alanine ligase